MNGSLPPSSRRSHRAAVVHVGLQLQKCLLELLLLGGLGALEGVGAAEVVVITMVKWWL